MTGGGPLPHLTADVIARWWSHTLTAAEVLSVSDHVNECAEFAALSAPHRAGQSRPRSRGSWQGATAHLTGRSCRIRRRDAEQRRSRPDATGDLRCVSRGGQGSASLPPALPPRRHRQGALGRGFSWPIAGWLLHRVADRSVGHRPTRAGAGLRDGPWKSMARVSCRASQTVAPLGPRWVSRTRTSRSRPGARSPAGEPTLPRRPESRRASCGPPIDGSARRSPDLHLARSASRDLSRGGLQWRFPAARDEWHPSRWFLAPGEDSSPRPGAHMEGRADR